MASRQRRHLLAGTGAAAACLLLPDAAFARAELTPLRVRVASNQGVENASLQQLLADRGIGQSLALEIELVEGRSVSAPTEALLADQADVCMISAFAGVVPAIARGVPLRLIGAAMRLPALAVYTRRDDIRRVPDLRGRTVGVGGHDGLLEVLMRALLRKRGMDDAQVTFVDAGSSAQVLEAVAAGKVDAGVSGVAGLGGTGRAAGDAVRVLEDGRLWQALPEYTYQPAYASIQALNTRAEAVARCLAVYTRLYRYLSAPGSRTAYLEARRLAAHADSPAEGEAVWNFIQRTQPYALQPGLSPRQVHALQEINVALGLQPQVLPFARMADSSPAHAAAKLL
jgi:NitT/TauT family transport system substrate-binding protein